MIEIYEARKVSHNNICRADENLAFLLKYENVAWYEDGIVKILDRRIYPTKIEYVVCKKHEDVAQSISDMVTQSGGPYIAALMGMTLAAHEAMDFTEAKFFLHMDKAAYILSHARPTTVKKMTSITKKVIDLLRKEYENGKSGKNLVDAVFEYNLFYLNSHYSKYEKVSFNLLSKIPENGTVMTQCYAETVLGMVLRAVKKRGDNVKFICPETRPYYQGAKLTASVICDMGFDVTVITDNAVAYTMKEKKVDLITSAADVICMDGSIVNKIGTFQFALAANHWGIPYYVTGTPSIEHLSVGTVSIEQREPEAVLGSMGHKHVMVGVKGFYPVFDITPPQFCDGVITDRGVFSCYELMRYFS